MLSLLHPRTKYHDARARQRKQEMAVVPAVQLHAFLAKCPKNRGEKGPFGKKCRKTGLFCNSLVDIT
jgi:hypothetical protein